jgi:hypothetical protein
VDAVGATIRVADWATHFYEELLHIDSCEFRDTPTRFSLATFAHPALGEPILQGVNEFFLVSSASQLGSAARAETREKLGKNHRHDCNTEERNTDEPRYEKAVTRKFFGKNDNG